MTDHKRGPTMDALKQAIQELRAGFGIEKCLKTLSKTLEALAKEKPPLDSE